MGTMTLSYLETISSGIESLEEIFPSSLTSSDKHDVTQKKFPLLPSVIKNVTFRKFENDARSLTRLEQSAFFS